MPEKSLRVVFMGTPDFAASALRALINSGHDVVAVYSQPPRPKGRGQTLQKSAVHTLAEQNNIPVFTPRNFRDEKDRQDFAALRADVAVVAAYGLILPQAILDAPLYGCLNIHGSLLPRWRGAAPIHRAILAGDDKTGITIMQMDAGLDTGPMISREEIAITPDMTTGALHDALSGMGARMIVAALDRLARDGTLPATAQPDDGVTYAEKISKDEARIDWSQSADQIHRMVRAFYPAPGAWCMAGDKRVKILSVGPSSGSGDAGEIINTSGDIACGQGVLRLLSVQPEGKKPMDIVSALNGGYLITGERLT
jgi:methionyl-tRNA formyltransferase